jgi:hypothetical protein
MATQGTENYAFKSQFRGKNVRKMYPGHTLEDTSHLVKVSLSHSNVQVFDDRFGEGGCGFHGVLAFHLLECSGVKIMNNVSYFRCTFFYLGDFGATFCSKCGQKFGRLNLNISVLMSLRCLVSKFQFFPVCNIYLRNPML